MLGQVSILLKYIQETNRNRDDPSNQLNNNNNNNETSPSPMSQLLHKYTTLRNEMNSVCRNSSRPCSLDKWFAKQTNTLLQGMACRTNRSLNFFLLDYNQHKHALKKVAATPNNPSLLIVDLNNEKHFTLSERLGASSMGAFVLQFNLGLLQHKSSTKEHVVKTSPPPPTPPPPRKNRVVILELTSQTFEDVVLREGRHVFVMFYSAWCGVCKATNLVYLRLAHVHEGEVLFARIDGDKHELPWHYTAPLYPSFVLFPKNRKHLTFSYPPSEDVTVENLSKFLDVNSGEVAG